MFSVTRNRVSLAAQCQPRRGAAAQQPPSVYARCSSMILGELCRQYVNTHISETSRYCTAQMPQPFEGNIYYIFLLPMFLPPQRLYPALPDQFMMLGGFLGPIKCSPVGSSLSSTRASQTSGRAQSQWSSPTNTCRPENTCHAYGVVSLLRLSGDRYAA